MSAVADAAVHAPQRRTAVAAGLRAWLRLPPDLLWQQAWYDLRKPLFASSLYRLLLPNRVAVGPLPTPLADTWPGDAAQGQAIAQGIFRLGGQTIRDPAPVWAPIGAQPAWLEEQHAFEWLRDLRAANGEAGRRAARELVGRWIDDYRAWDAFSWRPDLVGRRLAAWLGHMEFLGAPTNTLFRRRLLVSVARQTHHLARVLPGGLSGGALLAAIAGLILGGLALPRGGHLVIRGGKLLRRELARQVFADGGHRERSPSAQFAVLRLLTNLRAALANAQAEIPSVLDDTIKAMMPILRLFQHGDGGLALFNDSNEEQDWLVDMALARAGAAQAAPRGVAPKEAADSGFQRLAAGRTLVIVDGGCPPSHGFNRHAHAGTLSFEMSVGRERLIVNCGAHGGRGEWRQAQRSTAAHSTLVVDDTNSSVFSATPGMIRGPRSVTCRREEADGNVWLEMSHDGYEPSFGLIHRRRLFLTAGGEDLRGEDRLVGDGRRPFVIRFHLHPDVAATPAHNGQAVLLRLAGGAGWRLRATGGSVSLSESVYLGRRGEMRRSQQVVIAGEKRTTEDAVVKWAIAREAKPGRSR
jgi:uncharacterized heparinase superfamily protein